eukprot:552503-Rhodomonas_salina.4
MGNKQYHTAHAHTRQCQNQRARRTIPRSRAARLLPPSFPPPSGTSISPSAPISVPRAPSQTPKKDLSQIPISHSERLSQYRTSHSEIANDRTSAPGIAERTSTRASVSTGHRIAKQQKILSQYRTSHTP